VNQLAALFSQNLQVKNHDTKVDSLRKALVTSSNSYLVSFLQSNGHIAMMVKFHGQLISFSSNQVVT
jgi:hypothetical protein